MNKLQKFISVSMMAVSLLSLAPTVLAQTSTGNLGSGYLLPEGIGATIGTGSGDVRSTVANIIRTAMGLLGIIAVVIILIGGFTWMTAGGNDEKVGEAKKWIFSGIIGLAIVLSAYAIASFVISNLLTATQNSTAY